MKSALPSHKWLGYFSGPRYVRLDGISDIARMHMSKRKPLKELMATDQFGKNGRAIL